MILMGIEHERIHLETSSVLIRQLPVGWVKPQPAWPVCPMARHQREAVPANTLPPMPGGTVTLGKTDDTYGWDVEYGRQQIALQPFQASKMLVSNAEFLAFVEAGVIRTLAGGMTKAGAGVSLLKRRCPPSGSARLRCPISLNCV